MYLKPLHIDYRITTPVQRTEGSRWCLASGYLQPLTGNVKYFFTFSVFPLAKIALAVITFL
jgi:hypothetical protein